MTTTLDPAELKETVDDTGARPSWRYRVHGYTVESELDLSGAAPAPAGSPIDARLTVSRDPPSGCSAPRPPPRYVTPAYMPAEPGTSYLYRLPRWDVLGHSGAYEFYVRADRIHCRLIDPSDLTRARLAFLGAIAAYWLELRGSPVLHASAVVVDGRAVAFMGANGAGKSSLAAAFLDAGHALLTDDALALDVGDPPVAHPGIPRMRFHAEHAGSLIGDRVALSPIHPAVAKRQVAVGAGSASFGAFCSRPVPLAAIYLPCRDPEPDLDPRIRIVDPPPREALIQLVRFSSVASAVEAAGMQPRRLAALRSILAAVPIRHISFASGVRQLPLVRDAILADLGRAERSTDNG